MSGDTVAVGAPGHDGSRGPSTSTRSRAWSDRRADAVRHRSVRSARAARWRSRSRARRSSAARSTAPTPALHTSTRCPTPTDPGPQDRPSRSRTRPTCPRRLRLGLDGRRRRPVLGGDARSRVRLHPVGRNMEPRRDAQGRRRRRLLRSAVAISGSTIVAGAFGHGRTIRARHTLHRRGLELDPADHRPLGR